MPGARPPLTPADGPVPVARGAGFFRRRVAAGARVVRVAGLAAARRRVVRGHLRGGFLGGDMSGCLDRIVASAAVVHLA
jgi:hypothetical protein